jgi:EAL domain-containing protein (putative c-di-GMP-specific phosphodiesterase class I)
MLNDGELSGILTELGASYPDISPSLLCAEVSADMLFENLDKIEKELETVRSMGYRIAISEIGSEFSPSFRLAKFNFDYAVLDKSLVKELKTEMSERAVGGIVSYLHHLGARVVAPLLENEDAVATVKKLQCDGFSSVIPNVEEDDKQ